jgi:hypothetical protein
MYTDAEINGKHQIVRSVSAAVSSDATDLCVKAAEFTIDAFLNLI